MKLVAIWNGERAEFAVDAERTLAELEKRILAHFKLEKRSSIFLSINKRDRISSDDSATLKNLGLVDGDYVYVLEETRAAPGVAECPQSAGPAGGEAQELLAFEPLFQLFETQFNSILSKRQLNSPIEIMAAAIYATFRANRFKNADDSEGIPEDWDSLSAAGFFRFRFRLPGSKSVAEVTCTATGDMKRKAFVEARFPDDADREKVFATFELDFLPAASNSLPTSDVLKNMVKRIQDDVVICILTDTRARDFHRLPFLPFASIVKHLTAKEFLNLTSTCKTLHLRRADQTIWKFLVKRDFPDVINRLEGNMPGVNWQTQYRMHYQQKRGSASKWILRTPHLEEPRQYPRPDQPQPVPFPGIGGPEDINPLGGGRFRFPDIFPEMNRGHEFYPGRPQPPRGPRYDPPFPYDPDGLIRMPPPGRRGWRGGRRGNFPPDNMDPNYFFQ